MYANIILRAALVVSGKISRGLLKLVFRIPRLLMLTMIRSIL